jgi:hypothetical protein
MMNPCLKKQTATTKNLLKNTKLKKKTNKKRIQYLLLSQRNYSGGKH